MTLRQTYFCSVLMSLYAVQMGTKMRIFDSKNAVIRQ